MTTDLFCPPRVSDFLITPPALPALDLDEVKKSLRFTPTSEDTLIDVFISAAEQHFEDITGRQLIEATWERRINGAFSGVIELPHPPLLEVLSVTSGDEGDEDTFDPASYVVTAPSGPHAARGWLKLVDGASWPTATETRIRYKAGYGPNPGAVPELVRVALGFLVGHFHKYRAEVQETKFAGALTTLPLGADAILKSFKYSALPVYPLRSSLGPWV